MYINISTDSLIRSVTTTTHQIQATMCTEVSPFMELLIGISQLENPNLAPMYKALYDKKTCDCLFTVHPAARGKITRLVNPEFIYDTIIGRSHSKKPRVQGPEIVPKYMHVCDKNIDQWPHVVLPESPCFKTGDRIICCWKPTSGIITLLEPDNGSTSVYCVNCTHTHYAVDLARVQLKL